METGRSLSRPHPSYPGTRSEDRAAAHSAAGQHCAKASLQWSRRLVSLIAGVRPNSPTQTTKSDREALARKGRGLGKRFRDRVCP